ncbi:MAG TPA: hypothetical protein VJT31_17645 [Rugosimonospora sp.]|nr:hypothetical protein [Rugosimonospora sp.]
MRTTSGTTARLLIGASAGLLALLVSAGCSSGSSSSGSTSSGTGGGGAAAGGGASTTITEVLGPPDKYSFSPATVTVASGQALAITNKSDEDHDLTCTPDPGVSADMLKVAKSGSASVTFSKAGTYNCVSQKGAKLTVTVS